jgi:hypothetical protein
MHHQVTSTEMLFSHHNDAFRSSSLFRPKRRAASALAMSAMNRISKIPLRAYADQTKPFSGIA